jgi:hypothetical protein
MRPTVEDAVVVDFETDADKKYSLKNMSPHAYIRDPRFNILTVAIFVGGDDHIRFFYKFGGAGASLEDARALLIALAAAGKMLVAHNVAFDGLILWLHWGIKFEQYFDTTGFLRFNGLGASLENGAPFVGRKKLQAPPFTEESLRDPGTLQQMATYNVADVFVTQLLLERALIDPNFSDLEFWACGQNCREGLEGIAIDCGEASRLVTLYQDRRNECIDTICREYPGFDTSGLGSPKQVKTFCRDAFGVDLASLDQKDQRLLEAKAHHPGLALFLARRAAVGAWSKESKKMAALAKGSGRVFSPLKYYGAHTGRYAGAGRDAGSLNIQNFSRGDGAYPEMKLSRGVLAAETVESWVSGDLSTIEPRITAFLAGETVLVALFARGDDVYIWFAGQAFPGVRVVKGGEGNHLRQLSKATVIALGFGMGLKGFYKGLRKEAPDLEFSVAKQLFEQYRVAFPHIIALRHAYWKAFENAVENGVPSQVGYCTIERLPEAPGWENTVRVWLPTGRPLYYRSIRKTQELAPWGGFQWTYWYAPAFHFDPTTQRAPKKKPGLRVRRFADGQYREMFISQTLIGNIVSATARDLLVGQMREIEDAGLRMQFSVHDELVVASGRCVCARRDAPVPRGDRVESNHEADCPWVAARAIVADRMSVVPACFPGLAGLPVACELSDTIRDRYGK